MAKGHRTRHQIPKPQIQTRSGLRQFQSGGLWHINFTLIDGEGPFKWPTESDHASLLLIWLMRLNQKCDRKSLEEGTLSHFKGTIHHSIPIGDCSEAAQQRISELQLERKWAQILSGNLMRLRYCLAPNSTERVWGHMEDPDEEAGTYESIFYPIWWDPNHDVQPDSNIGEFHGSCYTSNCLHPF